MSKANEVLAEICSAMQYLVDRGETEVIDDVVTKVRYTDVIEIESFVVKVGKKRIEITAKEIK